MPPEDQTSYAAALKRYLARDFASTNYYPNRDDWQWLKDIDTPSFDDRDVDLIRSRARKYIEELNKNSDPQRVQDDVDPEHPGNIAYEPCPTIARDVATQKTIEYFRELQAYLRAREIGIHDIDEIRTRVAATSHALLRELREIIPNFAASERTAENAKFIKPDFHQLIDLDKVRRETGFANLFRVSDIHHFGDFHGDPSLGTLDNAYSGIRAADILFFLNGERDVDLEVANICADGTVDVAPESKHHMRSGLDMTLDKVPESAQANLADRIVFSSRAEKFDGVALTKEILEKNGLLPAWRVAFGDSVVYLPNTLYLKNEAEKDNRMRTVLYIEDEKKGLVVRSCYKSLSHALWKLLPAHWQTWYYHKAEGEEQITLPPELQRAISYLCSIKEISEADMVFFGTTGEEHGLLHVSGSFRDEVTSKPILLGEGFFAGRMEGKVDPESPSSWKFTDEEDKPDFSHIVDSWEELTNLYGAVTFEVFESRNERLQYVVCRDAKQRAWIGAIYMKAEKMTSQGVKGNWIFAGDLCTPALEHRQQAGKYGYGQFGGEYVDVFKTYISHIPLIQEYLTSVAARA